MAGLGLTRPSAHHRRRVDGRLKAGMTTDDGASVIVSEHWYNHPADLMTFGAYSSRSVLGRVG
jgi:hypothetical protein